MKTSRSWNERQQQQEIEFNNQQLWINWIKAEMDACKTLEEMIKKHQGYPDPMFEARLQSKRKWLSQLINPSKETRD